MIDLDSPAMAPTTSNVVQIAGPQWNRLVDELRACRKVVEKARGNVTCWIDLNQEDIPYDHNGDCPGCAIVTALAKYEALK